MCLPSFFLSIERLWTCYVTDKTAEKKRYQFSIFNIQRKRKEFPVMNYSYVPFGECMGTRSKDTSAKVVSS